MDVNVPYFSNNINHLENNFKSSYCILNEQKIPLKNEKNISAYYPKTNTIYNKYNKENKNYIENFSTENDDYIWGVNEKDEIFKKKIMIHHGQK